MHIVVSEREGSENGAEKYVKIMDKFAQHLRKIMTYRTKELSEPQAE